MKLKIQRVAYDAVLTAITVALGYFSLDLGTFKLTFENFPIIVAGLLFGPFDGALTGFAGIFLSQLLKYGVDLSTPLWILPYFLSGIFVGLFAKRERYEKWWKLLLLLAVNAVLVTGVNTFSLIIYNRYLLGASEGASTADVLLKVPMRLLTNAIKIAVYLVILPFLLRALRKTIRQRGRRG